MKIYPTLTTKCQLDQRVERQTWMAEVPDSILTEVNFIVGIFCFHIVKPLMSILPLFANFGYFVKTHVKVQEKWKKNPERCKHWQLSSNVAAQLPNDLCCSKHCWGFNEQISIVNEHPFKWLLVMIKIEFQILKLWQINSVISSLFKIVGKLNIKWKCSVSGLSFGS